MECYPWVVDAVTETTIIVAWVRNCCRISLFLALSKSFPNSLTVITYSNCPTTKDSNSGNLFEYLSLVNLCIVAEKYENYRYIVIVNITIYIIHALQIKNPMQTVSLPISLSMSTAILLASTINWYSGSDSTGPTMSADFLGTLLCFSICAMTFCSCSESRNLANSRTEDTLISVIRKQIIYV